MQNWLYSHRYWLVRKLRFPCGQLMACTGPLTTASSKWQRRGQPFKKRRDFAVIRKKQTAHFMHLVIHCNKPNHYCNCFRNGNTLNVAWPCENIEGNYNINSKATHKLRTLMYLLYCLRGRHVLLINFAALFEEWSIADNDCFRVVDCVVHWVEQVRKKPLPVNLQNKQLLS